MINYGNSRRLAYSIARHEAAKKKELLQIIEPFHIRNLDDENKHNFSQVILFLDFHLCPHKSKIAMIKRLASEGKEVYIHTEDYDEIEAKTGANKIKSKCDTCGKTISDENNQCLNCKEKNND